MTVRNRSAFSRKLSRRALVGTGTAAAAGSILLPNASASPRISFPRASRAQDETPKPGGTLIYGLSTDPSNFEPHFSTGAASTSVKLMCYSTLLTYDADNQLIGDLAEEFGWVDDTTYQVKIREGVTFHDGSDMTLDDVVFSFQRIMDPETGATNAPFFNEVTDVAAGDGNTVNFTFSKPFAAFPYILANTNSYIVSQAWIESGVDPKIEMMGTGPFKFVERVPGVAITLEKNPDYFIEGLPYLDGIEFQPMPDDTSRMTALRSGSVDFADYVPYTQMQIIESDPNFTFASDSISGFGWIGFNHEMDIVNDQNVRQAIAHGMNRETMVQTAYAGYGSPITGGLVPEGMLGHAPDLEGTFTGDYDLAKSLLDEAGHNPLELPMLSTSTYTVISRPAEAAQAELTNANINMDLELQEWLTFRQSVADGTHPVHAWGTSFAYGDPDFLYQYMHSSGNSAKWFRFADDQLDALLDEGRFSTDEALRDEIYQEVQTRAAEIIPWIYTIRRTQGEAMASYVKGYFHTEAWVPIGQREIWLDK